MMSLALRILEGHTDWVSSVAFSLYGKVLASGIGDGSVRLLDVGTCMALEALEGKENVYALAFSPDGQIQFSGHIFGTVRFWDVATGAMLRTLEGHTSSVVGLASLRGWKDIGIE